MAVEHLSVSPSPSRWARVEARPESRVRARLEKMVAIRVGRQVFPHFMSESMEKKGFTLFTKRVRKAGKRWLVPECEESPHIMNSESGKERESIPHEV